jgi:hypothetical protein
MTEGDLLQLSACLLGHRVGQPDGVEVVPTTVTWPSGAISALAYPRLGPARPYRPGPASRTAGPEASRPRRPGAVDHQVQQPAALQVDQTGHPSGRRRRSNPKNARLSSKPKAATPSRRAVSSTSGVLWAPPPASRSPSQRRGRQRPRPPRGRPCRPADRPERRLVGSAPPWDGSGPPAGPGASPAGWLTTAPDPLAPGSTTGQPPLGRSRTRTMRRP